MNEQAAIDMGMSMREFYVVHPLDDVVEKKLNPKDAEPMELTPSTKVALFALRAYLLLVLVLLGWHFVYRFW
jgi:hypothetical protein